MEKDRWYVTKPFQVEAFQFSTWSDFITIAAWFEHRLYYVGQGFEHALRNEGEHDRGNGHIREDAVPFLVATDINGKQTRIDRAWWIVRHNYEYLYIDPVSFSRMYVKEEPEQ